MPALFAALAVAAVLLNSSPFFVALMARFVLAEPITRLRVAGLVVGFAGVLVAGDRRATSGNTVVYDRADKVLEIDQRSIMAIAGVPATAWEMARVLEHSFQFFRRTQLQEMSVDGKVRALSKLLRDNFGFALQGVGIVVPICATYDAKVSPSGRLYFYDAMGAQFEVTDYAATGSGSSRSAARTIGECRRPPVGRDCSGCSSPRARR